MGNLRLLDDRRRDAHPPEDIVPVPPPDGGNNGDGNGAGNGDGHDRA